MAHDRFDENHSFNVLGFIQLLYDTTCVNIDFWVKPLWGLGCLKTQRFSKRSCYYAQFQISTLKLNNTETFR